LRKHAVLKSADLGIHLRLLLFAVADADLAATAHFAQLVATLTEHFCQFFVAGTRGDKVAVFYGDVKEVELGFLIQIRHVNGQVVASFFGNTQKCEKAAMERGEMVMVAAVGILGKDDDALALADHAQTFTDGGAETDVAVGGNQVEPAVEQICKRRDDQASQTGKVDVPTVFLMVVNLGLVFVGGAQAFAHFMGAPDTDGLIVMHFEREGAACTNMVADDDSGALRLFA